MPQTDLSIKGLRDTKYRRTAVLAVVKLLGRWLPRSGGVIFLPGNVCIKYGRSVRLTEALTMDFVRQNTNIPVPEVYCAFEDCGRSYIAMQRLPGRMLARGWTSRHEASKHNVLEELRVYVGELRSLRRDENDLPIAAIDGGPIFDYRFPGFHLAGPFRSVEQFHLHLRSNVKLEPGQMDDVQRVIKMHEETEEAVRFTHNDLSSFNILVSGDKVTGLIDWENAGWLPHYWEYTSAWHVNPQNMFWQDYVGKFLDVFERELEMEQLRHRFFGDF